MATKFQKRGKLVERIQTIDKVTFIDVYEKRDAYFENENYTMVHYLTKEQYTALMNWEAKTNDVERKYAIDEFVEFRYKTLGTIQAKRKEIFGF